MKLVIAIIQPNRLEAVKKELNSVDVSRITVTDVMGYGQQGGHTEVYRGTEFIKNLIKKVRVEIACNDEFVEPTITAICKAARTQPEGAIGDGKIMVLPLEQIVRIRTGERGSKAI